MEVLAALVVLTLIWLGVVLAVEFAGPTVSKWFGRK